MGEATSPAHIVKNRQISAHISDTPGSYCIAFYGPVYSYHAPADGTQGSRSDAATAQADDESITPGCVHRFGSGEDHPPAHGTGTLGHKTRGHESTGCLISESSPPVKSQSITPGCMHRFGSGEDHPPANGTGTLGHKTRGHESAGCLISEDSPR
jgi:hypothetical protein